jgi:hypothetical protein
MSRDNGSVDQNLLDEATIRLSQASIPALPPDLIRTTLRAIPGHRTTRADYRSRNSVLYRWFGIAATIVVTFAAVVGVFTGGSQQVAVGQVLANVRDADSVEFVMTFGRGQAVGNEHKCWMQQDRTRIEHASGIVIIHDTTRRELVYVDRRNKLAGRFPLNAGAAVELTNNPVQQLRQMRPDSARAMGEEPIDGKVVKLFKVRGVQLLGVDGERADIYVWADPNTRLPVRIEIRTGEAAFVTIKDLRWNKPLDPALFAMDIPSDYKEQSEDLFRRSLNANFAADKTLTPTEAFRRWRDNN